MRKKSLHPVNVRRHLITFELLFFGSSCSKLTWMTELDWGREIISSIKKERKKIPTLKFFYAISEWLLGFSSEFGPSLAWDYVCHFGLYGNHLNQRQNYAKLIFFVIFFLFMFFFFFIHTHTTILLANKELSNYITFRHFSSYFICFLLTLRLNRDDFDNFQ